MKSHKAERMALARTVEQLVIPFPSIHFTFTSEGKKILETPVAAGVRERLAQVAGHEFARGLIECTAERENQAATILISPPEQASARPRFQYLYVNLRRVDNDSITYGIRESFSRFMMSQYRPAWFCFLDIDPTSVDVNIHPTKQRVKFDDDRKLFGFVHKAVRNGIDQWMVSRDDAMSDRSASGSSENRHVEGPRGRESQPDMLGARSTPAPGDTEPRSEEAPVDDQGVQTSLSFLSIASQTHKGIDRQSDESVQLQEEQWDLIPCYQIHKLYILAPIKKGILLIDQHAAHERILYEQALVEFRQEGRAASQRLLFPIVLELAQTEKSVVIAGRDFYSALGFDIQDWGGRAVAISAIPATGFLRESGIEKALHEMVRFLMDDKTSEFFTAPEKRFAAAYACGAAIKAGQVLKQEEMNSLLNNLFAVENPYVCPHGRPTMVRISLDELGRRFLR
jgi:DNA mismatch repair protein MutL